MIQRNQWPLFVATVLLFQMCCADASAALQPANLRCAQRVNPLGIDDLAPRLSWKLQGAEKQRGETQSAYQIQVGSTPGAADLWDSGKVKSSETYDVLYAGKPLASGKKVYWRVRVFDGNNNASDWSAPAYWSMGLLTGWTAEWIGFDEAYSLNPHQAAQNKLLSTAGLSWIRCRDQQVKDGLHHAAFRKTVALPDDQKITNAVFALYADNQASVFVNGQQATGIAQRWEATAHIDVTALMRSGNNLIALSATNTDAQEPARVIGQLVVQFASGSVSKIPVDTSWKTAAWPSGNWTQINYDNSSWADPAKGGSPWGTPSLHDSARMPVPYLRKDFAVDQPVSRATVYVTALGTYELRLNGRKVGNDVLAPGWTDFSKRVYYQTYDVTDQVQRGDNTIGAMLGDGWYASNLAFKGSRLNYGGTPRLLAQLVIEFANGKTQVVATDASWKASYGPIRFADLLLGSEYDARLEMPGWDTPKFNDRAWSPVVTGLSEPALRHKDVTELLQSKVSNGRLNIEVLNDDLGGDPAYGVVKTLQIAYQVDARIETNSFAEKTVVNLGRNGESLKVLAAYYGDARQFPGAAGIQIQAAITEPSRHLETLPAIRMTEPKPGLYTFDIGQNMVGWVRLKISGKRGDRITVRHGEMLNEDGTIYTANLRGANSTDFYILATNGPVVLEPRFTFHGFQYVEVRGLSVPPTLESVEGMVVNSDIQQTGKFASSNPLLNQLFHNIIWGQKGNYLEVPTDCPQRDERLGWTGDTQFFAPTAAYNFDVQSFFRRYLITLCQDSQYPNGSFAHVAPDLSAGSGSAAWGDAAWISPYLMHQVYGDTNMIAEHYDSFKVYGEFLARHARDYVINRLPGDHGDWVNLGGGASSKVIDTAYYAYYAKAMSEMAALIGRTADVKVYSELHREVAAAFAGFFKEDGSFADGSSQTGYALAFTLNLVPAELREKAAQRFAESIAKFDHHLATGFIGTPRLLPALSAAGRDDLAYRLLLNETYPSWLYQVKLGATTMWERWDGWTPMKGFQTIGMNSFNHYAFGAGGEYMFGKVGGISPASPGYKTIRIQPIPGEGLLWVNTEYDSARGMISTAWTNVGGEFHLEVVIPPNTTAQVFVPTTNATAITESGVLASKAPGVKYLGKSKDCAVYSVGSGRYLWKSPYQLPAPKGVVIETKSESGSGKGAFIPNRNVMTDGGLIADINRGTGVSSVRYQPDIVATHGQDARAVGSHGVMEF